jgi:branched-chain amino acid transport system ATP-binding protein
VLFDVNLESYHGEVTTVVGPNGSGKTTLLNSIFGFADIFSGSITFDKMQLNGMPPHETSKLGISYLPQMNNIFPDLSVKENLRLAGYLLDPMELNDTMDEVISLFPVIEPFMNRRAGTLSGGERQMLAIAMTLMRKPKLILLDEPLSGLAPLVCQKIADKILDLRDKLGISVMLVEQNAKRALEIGDKVHLMVSGKITFSGKTGELIKRTDLTELYLGLKN